ncbi:MAG: hypothetical protein KC620_03845 [Myxococcales bacterium]|nr:hypothetical protein [Myxococcales bacterium]
MAREIVVEHAGQTSRFAFSKIDRAKLYGVRRRVPLDADDRPCERAELTADGALLVRQGMAAQGYFAPDGRWVAVGELVGILPDGAVAPKSESTLGVAQPAEVVSPEALLDAVVNSVYALDAVDLHAGLASALAGGALVRFAFNYRPGSNPSVGFLVQNPEGLFALIGQPVTSEWCALEQPVVEPFADEDEADDDDLDFEMF